jgi:hypothetical protein
MRFVEGKTHSKTGDDHHRASRRSVWLILFVGLVILATGCEPVNVSQRLANTIPLLSTATSEKTPGISVEPQPPTITATFPAIPSSTPSPVSSSTPTVTSDPVKFFEELLTSSLLQYRDTDDKQGVYFYIRDTSAYYFLDLYSESHTGWPINILGIKVAELRFANYADLVAYIDIDSRVWIADLAKKHPVLIYTDPALIDWNDAGEDHDAKLIWTPDDHHLIIDYWDPSHEDLIYHPLTGQLEDWNFTCDSIALSPRTQRLAIWCSTNLDDHRYAVVEWRGEIWFSDTPSQNEPILSSPIEAQEEDLPFRSFPLYWNAGWSLNGEVAFFNDSDNTRTLFVADLLGEIVARYPNKGHRVYYDFSIQWSKDGRRLLVDVPTTPEQSCPKEVSPLDDSVGVMPSCWQVIDAATGETIWSLHDLVPLEIGWQQGIWRIYDRPTISANAEMLAIVSFAGGDRRFDIIDIDTGEILMHPPYLVEQARWGPVP